jgi:iron complex transport system ATP-binding protein
MSEPAPSDSAIPTAATTALAASGIAGRGLRVRYQPHLPAIIEHATILIPPGRITALIGPNGSGKSTLLKTLARHLRPDQGEVLLDGQHINRLSGRDLAKRLGILFQEHGAPADLSVEELVYHGRHPHRRMFEALTAADEQAVAQALLLADLVALRHRPLRELSSGQRQLAWIAMAVAQGSDHLFLDEPTTFLDLAHQYDVMELVRRLNREQGRTIVLIMHDLNLAAQYADHLVALQNGRIVCDGTPAEVLTRETLRQVFAVEAEIIQHPVTHTVFCIPSAKASVAPARG